MTEDTYLAITRVARAFRTYRYPTTPNHPHRDVADRLRDEWPELWEHLDTLQKRWAE